MVLSDTFTVFFFAKQYFRNCLVQNGTFIYIFVHNGTFGVLMQIYKIPWLKTGLPIAIAEKIAIADYRKKS